MLTSVRYNSCVFIKELYIRKAPPRKNVNIATQAAIIIAVIFLFILFTYNLH